MDAQGGEGDQGPTVEYDKPEYELRFDESFVAVCLDREEAPDEAKNYPFWGVRLRHQYDHVKWARSGAVGVVGDGRGGVSCWSRTESGSHGDGSRASRARGSRGVLLAAGLADRPDWLATFGRPPALFSLRWRLHSPPFLCRRR